MSAIDSRVNTASAARTTGSRDKSLGLRFPVFLFGIFSLMATVLIGGTPLPDC